VDAKSHGTEERLELYVLGRLPESEIIEIEEHLILCEPCRDRVEEIGAFAPAMRGALLQIEPGKQQTTDWFSWLRLPRFAAAGAFAAVVLTFGVYWMAGNNRVPPMASLTLTAMRGETVPEIGSSRELDLTITDAPAGAGQFVLQLVDASGESVWSGPAPASGPALLVKVRKRLSPGAYIVRLNKASGQLAHEYAFRVK
jgi:hypothetical protein